MHRSVRQFRSPASEFTFKVAGLFAIKCPVATYPSSFVYLNDPPELFRLIIIIIIIRSTIRRARPHNRSIRVRLMPIVLCRVCFRKAVLACDREVNKTFLTVLHIDLSKNSSQIYLQSFKWENVLFNSSRFLEFYYFFSPKIVHDTSSLSPNETCLYRNVTLYIVLYWKLPDKNEITMYFSEYNRCLFNVSVPNNL